MTVTYSITDDNGSVVYNLKDAKIAGEDNMPVYSKDGKTLLYSLRTIHIEIPAPKQE